MELRACLLTSLPRQTQPIFLHSWCGWAVNPDVVVVAAAVVVDDAAAAVDDGVVAVDDAVVVDDVVAVSFATTLWMRRAKMMTKNRPNWLDSCRRSNAAKARATNDKEKYDVTTTGLPMQVIRPQLARTMGSVLATAAFTH